MACSDPTVKSQCGKSTRTPNNPCCPSCGAVECLCRPRFFAGQLLSEQDLNRLDQYIKNKNRLHVRNLHGWGVVNGLKVLCEPCSSIKVTQGYAINPCGDDIVVCEATSVDICSLINKCKQSRMNYDCKPTGHAGSSTKPNASSCEDVEEEWVLAIQYEEWPSRGVTPLRGNSCNTSKSSCSCGGSSSGKSCGCGSSKSSATSQYTSSSKTNRAASTECEPTVLCESFSFDVYRKPIDDSKDDDDEDKKLFKLKGSFAEEFNCCSKALMATMPPMPDIGKDNDLINHANAISKWCCSWRKNLIDYFLTHPNTSCEVIEFLQKIDCPSLAKPNSFASDAAISFLSLFAAWAEGLKVCLCLALLPPTPDASCDLRVPLATVRIRTRDCKVLSICNWTTERKMVMTWPAMSHWLSILSIGDFFRNLLDVICCTSLLGIFEKIIDEIPDVPHSPGTSTFPQGHVQVTPNDKPVELHAKPNELSIDPNHKTNFEGVIVNKASVEKSTTQNNQAFSFSTMLSKFSAGISGELTLGSINSKSANFADFIGSSLARGTKPLEIGALLRSVSPRFKLPTNGQSLSDIEAKNIPLLLLGEMVVKPFAISALGEKEVKEQMRNLRTKTKATENTDEDIDCCREIEVIKQKMDEQAKIIAALTQQFGGKN